MEGVPELQKNSSVAIVDGLRRLEKHILTAVDARNGCHRGVK